MIILFTTFTINHLREEMTCRYARTFRRFWIPY